MPENNGRPFFAASKYLVSVIRPYKKDYLLASASILLQSAAALIQVKLTSKIIDSSSAKETSYIIKYIFFLIITFCANCIFTYLSSDAAAKLSANTVCSMKKRITTRLLHAPFGEVSELASGDVLSTFSSDTAVVGRFIADDLISLFSQAVFASAAFGYLIVSHPILCLMTFLYTPLGMFFTLSLNRKMNMLYPRCADLNGDALSQAEQALSCIPIIKSFQMERFVITRVEKTLNELYTNEMKIAYWDAWMQPACSTTSYIPRLCFLLFGGFQVFAGRISVGTLIALFGMLTFIIGPSVYFPFLMNGLGRSIASVNRIARLDSLSEHGHAEQQRIVSREPSVHIQNLCFSYKDSKPVVRNLNFSHTGFGMIAFTGPSGCGKSTLLRIIAGLYTADRGSVKVSGHPVLMPQDAYLFQGSIMENIRYGKPGASEREVFDAAQAAGAHAFITALPDGYNTQLENGAPTLSGGQKQRVSFARILLSHSSVWLLDEPTSALDEESERLVLNTVRRKAKEKLILVSAHRNSLISCADTVVALEGGIPDASCQGLSF